MKIPTGKDNEYNDRIERASALDTAAGSRLATFESDGDAWRLVGDECWSERPVIARQHASDFKGERIHLIRENTQVSGGVSRSDH